MEEIVKRLPPSTETSCPISPKALLARGIDIKDRFSQRLEQKLPPLAGTSSKEAGEASSQPLASYGINFVRALQAAGKNPAQVAEILVGTASAFVANSATAVAQLIDFYLEPKNASHWAEVVRLANENTAEADKTLMKYTLEGMRLSNTLAVYRIVEPETITIAPGMEAKRGNRVVLSFVILLLSTPHL